MPKRFHLLLLGLFLVTLALLSVFSGSQTPLILAQASTPAAAQSPADIARGKYLVTVADCERCHGTPKLARNGEIPLAGGREFVLGDLGTYYAPNISVLQDMDYGEFDQALRDGKEPYSDRALAPVMPYEWFHNLSDADTQAIFDYLVSVPRVANPGVPLPNPGPAADKIESLGQDSIKPITPNDSVQYGGYLVNAVGACGSCHSPKDASGAIIKGRELSGGSDNIGTADQPVYAPPIIGSVLSAEGYSRDTLATLLRNGTRPWGAGLRPEMPWQHFTVMSDNDITAVWNYLQTFKLDSPWPVTTPAATSAAAPLATEEATQAK